MILRPYGIVIDGVLELGLELVLEEGVIQEVRPHTGIPEPFVVAPAFVNAHSHLEYRGLMGKLDSTEYWPWIREITVAKRAQSIEDVRADCHLAAQENKRTGVAMIGEHSDRPYAGEALKSSGIGGVIFQEVITLSEPQVPYARLDAVERSAAQNRAEFGDDVHLSPHAFFSVDREVLRHFTSNQTHFSIHVAETPFETEFTRDGKGPMADLYRDLGLPFEPTGMTIIETLDELGLAKPGVQWVHCCDVSEQDVSLMAKRGVAVAHCPRSNRNLRCPIAPVREMLDAGVCVGLGLDSAASSGLVDMFAEMRVALEVAAERGRPLRPDEVWRMATNPDSLAIDRFYWTIGRDSETPLIKLHIPDATSTEDLIERCSPDAVEWLDTDWLVNASTRWRATLKEMGLKESDW